MPDARTTDVPTGNTYDKYSSHNPVERWLVARFLGALDAALPAAPPRSILEVGVGEGEVAQRVRARYPAARLVGIDLPDPALAARWTDRDLAAAFADVGWLPFPDGAFDLVLGIEVLEHVPDPPAALRELRRVATTDLVLSVPREPLWRGANLARGRYVRALGNTPGHLNHWSKRGFARFVEGQLRVTSVRAPFPWTMVTAVRSG